MVRHSHDHTWNVARPRWHPLMRMKWHERYGVSNRRQLASLINSLWRLISKKTKKIHITDPLWCFHIRRHHYSWRSLRQCQHWWQNIGFNNVLQYEIFNISFHKICTISSEQILLSLSGSHELIACHCLCRALFHFRFRWDWIMNRRVKFHFTITDIFTYHPKDIFVMKNTV